MWRRRRQPVVAPRHMSAMMRCQLGSGPVAPRAAPCSPAAPLTGPPRCGALNGRPGAMERRLLCWHTHCRCGQLADMIAARANAGPSRNRVSPATGTRAAHHMRLLHLRRSPAGHWRRRLRGSSVGHQPWGLPARRAGPRKVHHMHGAAVHAYGQRARGSALKHSLRDVIAINRR